MPSPRRAASHLLHERATSTQAATVMTAMTVTDARLGSGRIPRIEIGTK